MFYNCWSSWFNTIIFLNIVASLPCRYPFLLYQVLIIFLQVMVLLASFQPIFFTFQRSCHAWIYISFLSKIFQYLIPSLVVGLSLVNLHEIKILSFQFIGISLKAFQLVLYRRELLYNVVVVGYNSIVVEFYSTATIYGSDSSMTWFMSTSVIIVRVFAHFAVCFMSFSWKYRGRINILKLWTRWTIYLINKDDSFGCDAKYYFSSYSIAIILLNRVPGTQSRIESLKVIRAKPQSMTKKCHTVRRLNRPRQHIM